MVAPNGARKTGKDHPALPITPQQLAQTAQSCQAAGAAMIHLHVRDADQQHTLDVEAYRAAITEIRDRLGDRMVIQVTSEAVGRYTPAEQMAMVRALRPEAVSLAVRELVPDRAHEETAAEFFAWLDEVSIRPQYILYSGDDLKRFDELIDRGVIPGDRHFVLFVLGRYSKTQTSEPSDLLAFLSARREDRPHPWAVCAFGPHETACAIAAAALGGHARVGFENNLYLPDGTPAPDNAALVAAVARGADAIGRPLATIEQARQLMANP